jgi:uncharacterized protein (DUF2141 family)
VSVRISEDTFDHGLTGALVALALVSALVCGTMPAAVAAQTGDIRVIVQGLQSDEGQLRFGLYDSAATFAKDGKAVFKGTQPIKQQRCEFVIRRVPYGTYALMVAHDVNGDGHIDRSPVSRELKGVSNYTSKLFWYPSFEKAQFRLNKDELVVEVRVY